MFAKIAQLILVVLFRCIALLPFSILYFFSKVIYFLLFGLLNYRRYVVNINLNYALPYLSGEKFQPIARNFYKHLSELIIEIIKGLYIPIDELARRIPVDEASLQLLETYSTQNRNVVLMLGHYGNWEWALLIIGRYIKLKAFSLYTGLSFKEMDDYLLKKRQRFGATMIDATKDKNKLRQLKEQASIIAIVGDQSPTGRNKVYPTKFLNLDTTFFIGGEKIAKDLDAAVLFVNIKKISFAKYKIYLELITDDIQSIKSGQMIELYKNKLETQIMAHPEYWMWSHRRWKNILPY
ncbi:MAG: lysophospholipid acyltransferase family protein [Chitinophagales bacterium]|nr:lysophospholipid acyltransferase family protein [Chitinophagales bacterium]